MSSEAKSDKSLIEQQAIVARRKQLLQQGKRAVEDLQLEVATTMVVETQTQAVVSVDIAVQAEVAVEDKQDFAEPIYDKYSFRKHPQYAKLSPQEQAYFNEQWWDTLVANVPESKSDIQTTMPLWDNPKASRITESALSEIFAHPILFAGGLEFSHIQGMKVNSQGVVYFDQEAASTPIGDDFSIRMGNEKAKEVEHKESAEPAFADENAQLWWDCLYKRHAETAISLNPAWSAAAQKPELRRCFESFLVEIKKRQLVLPPLSPDSLAVTSSTSMPVALGRVLTLIKNQKSQEERQAQLREVPQLSLNSTGAVRALFVRQASAKCRFVTVGMGCETAKFTPIGYQPRFELEDNGRRYVRTRHIGERYLARLRPPSEAKNPYAQAKQEFWRYVAYQPRGMPLSFYLAEAENIEKHFNNDEVKVYLYECLAAISTNAALAFTENPKVMSERWASFLTKINRASTMTSLLGRENAALLILKKLHSLKIIPPADLLEQIYDLALALQLKGESSKLDSAFATLNLIFERFDRADLDLALVYENLRSAARLQEAETVGAFTNPATTSFFSQLAKIERVSEHSLQFGRLSSGAHRPFDPSEKGDKNDQYFAGQIALIMKKVTGKTYAQAEMTKEKVEGFLKDEEPDKGPLAYLSGSESSMKIPKVILKYEHVFNLSPGDVSTIYRELSVMLRLEERRYHFSRFGFPLEKALALLEGVQYQPTNSVNTFLTLLDVLDDVCAKWGMLDGSRENYVLASYIDALSKEHAALFKEGYLEQQKALNEAHQISQHEVQKLEQLFADAPQLIRPIQLILGYYEGANLTKVMSQLRELLSLYKATGFSGENRLEDFLWRWQRYEQQLGSNRPHTLQQFSELLALVLHSKNPNLLESILYRSDNKEADVTNKAIAFYRDIYPWMTAKDNTRFIPWEEGYPELMGMLMAVPVDEFEQGMIVDELPIYRAEKESIFKELSALLAKPDALNPTTLQALKAELPATDGYSNEIGASIDRLCVVLGGGELAAEPQEGSEEKSGPGAAAKNRTRCIAELQELLAARESNKTSYAHSLTEAFHRIYEIVKKSSAEVGKLEGKGEAVSGPTGRPEEKKEQQSENIGKLGLAKDLLRFMRLASEEKLAAGQKFSTRLALQLACLEDAGQYLTATELRRLAYYHSNYSDAHTPPKKPSELMQILECIGKVKDKKHKQGLYTLLARLVGQKDKYQKEIVTYEAFEKLSKNRAKFDQLEPHYRHPPFLSFTETLFASGDIAEKLRDHDARPFDRESKNEFNLADMQKKAAEFAEINSQSLNFSDADVVQLCVYIDVYKKLPTSEKIEELNALAVLPPAKRQSRLNRIKFTALLGELLFSTTGQALNHTQYLASLNFNLSKTPIIQQIGTGEGKERVLMVQCAARRFIFDEPAIDFVTDPPHLAERSFYDFRAYFSACGTPTQLVDQHADVNAYFRTGNPGINFCKELNLFLVRANVAKHTSCWNAGNGLVLDESDRATYEEEQATNLAKPMPSELGDTRWVYEYVMRFVSGKDFSAVYSSDEYMVPIEAFRKYLRQFVIDTDPRAKQINKFTEDDLENWLRAGILADGLQEDVHYKKENNTLCFIREGVRQATKISPIKNSITYKGSTFSGEVHQCLCAKINNTLADARRYGQVDEASALQTFAYVDYPSQIVSTRNNSAWLADYQGRISAASGTAGSALQRQSLALSLPGMRVFDVPAHQPSKLQRLFPYVAGTETQQHEILIQKATKTRRPVLVVCKNAAERDRVYKAFLAAKTRAPREDKRWDSRNVRAIDDQMDADQRRKAIAEGGAVDSVLIVTDEYARGVHYPVTEEAEALGGMYVFYLETSEAESADIQREGRAARQGMKGMARPVLLNPTLMHRSGTETHDDIHGLLGAIYTQSERESQQNRLAQTFINMHLSVLQTHYLENLSRSSSVQETQWMNFIAAYRKAQNNVMDSIRPHLANCTSEDRSTAQLATETIAKSLSDFVKTQDRLYEAAFELGVGTQNNLSTRQLEALKKQLQAKAPERSKKLGPQHKSESAHDSQSVVYDVVLAKRARIWRRIRNRSESGEGLGSLLLDFIFTRRLRARAEREGRALKNIRRRKNTDFANIMETAKANSNWLFAFFVVFLGLGAILFKSILELLFAPADIIRNRVPDTTGAKVAGVMAVGLMSIFLWALIGTLLPSTVFGGLLAHLPVFQMHISMVNVNVGMPSVLAIGLGLVIQLAVYGFLSKISGDWNPSKSATPAKVGSTDKLQARPSGAPSTELDHRLESSAHSSEVTPAEKPLLEAKRPGRSSSS